MELDDALRIARGGNALIFLGSGFSLGARDVKDREILSASKLADYFCDASKEPSGLSLPVAAAQYQKSVTKVKFSEEIKSRFSVGKTTPEQDVILTLPWVRSYTTNYDNIVELSTSASKKPFQPATLSSRPSPLDRTYRQCVHLNGYAPSAKPDSVNIDFRLTQASYLTTHFWKTNGIVFSRTICFSLLA